MTTSIFATEPLLSDPKNEASTPRAFAKIDGTSYGIKEYELTTNIHGATDTCSVTLPISINPDFPFQLFRGPGGVAQGAGTNPDQPVYLELWSGFPSNPTSGASTQVAGLTRRFLGIVDQYSAAFKADEVTFEGRSLAAPLVSAKIMTPFAGQQMTTTEFVTQMAKQYGLTGVKLLVPANPLTMQQVLANEYQTGVHVYGVWNLILQAAMQDDVDAWVDSNGTLWYAAATLIPRATIALKWGRDIDDLTATHGVQFSKNIEVRVHSYKPVTRTSSSTRAFTGADGSSIESITISRVVNSTPNFGTLQTVTTSTNSLGQTTYTVSSKTPGGAATGIAAEPASESGKQIYERWFPNLTAQECIDRAHKIYRQIVMHEYQVTMRLPMTPSLFANMDVTALLQISGAPYGLINTQYWPRQIREHVSAESGAYWEIDATNVSPPQAGV